MRTWMALASLAGLSLLPASNALAFSFSTGNPDGKMGVASRPASSGEIEIEAADDFILPSATELTSATFTGLLPSGFNSSNVSDVTVEIYRVFPKDSVSPPSGKVPTRNNSPSDNAFTSRDSASAELSFSLSQLSDDFTVANTVVNGIHPKPGQTTGGEGSANGAEVKFTVNFTKPIDLPADHYFFVPQVSLATQDSVVGTQFLWLSAPKPTTPPFVGDLQSWVRNENLAPDWLRVGMDIVGGTTPPAFNQSFSLEGSAITAVPLPAMAWPALGTLTAVGAAGLMRGRKRLASGI